MKMEGGGVASLQQLRQEMSAGKFKLYAILIYSDADTSFIRFLESSHNSLATMGGNQVFLFWFEHFERDSALLWKPGQEQPKQISKIARTESLRLAKALDIPMTSTPCLLLCQSLDDARSVVYSFDNLWSHEHLAEHFKAVFDHVEEVLKELKKNPKLDVYESLEGRFGKLKMKKWVKRVVSNQSIGNMLRAIATGGALAG